MAGYRGVLAQYPLSWYALLAHERLQGYGPEEAEAALAEAIEGCVPPASPLAAIPDPLWSNPQFRRGVELVRMGLAQSARRELQAVELGAEVVDPRVLTWTKIVLYEAAGAHDLATHLARGEESAFGAYWPVGDHRRLWELAHQRGFSDLVERWARERDLDPAWIYSVIREESGFNPKIESWANAIGLMQIILPTAKGLARGTKLKPTRANLRRPEVAVELGTKYLRDLLERHPALPLASAGYNAGSGAVNKWRRARGRQPLDEFVERIPYREARGYAKRVTRSVARYRWLHGDGAILDLPLDPPGRP
jgi:soluble lytic murein transglycosylase